MERNLKILRNFVIIILLSCAFMPNVYAASAQGDLSVLITAQNIKYQDCTKVFNTNNINLLYLTIAAINANRFKIEEIQSKSGYVLFTAVNKQFLASISNVNTNQALLRITPVDNNYYFQPGIISNIFKYIDLNIHTKIQNIELN